MHGCLYVQLRLLQRTWVSLHVHTEHTQIDHTIFTALYNLHI